MDRFLHGEAYFYLGMIVQCQSYHGNYAYPRGGATMLVGDGMDSRTRVSATMGAWVPVVLSYNARQSVVLPFMGPALLAYPGAESPWVSLLGAWVRSLMGYKEGSKWANKR
jgi:hypothetical protein